MSKLKYILLLALVFSFSAIFLSSCLDDDDEVTIDEEWKSKNETEFKAVGTSNTDFYKIYSLYSGNNEANSPDYIWAKPSSEIETLGLSIRATVDGHPEFNDSVYCRYEGWYFTKDNEKYIFDSTEGKTTGSTSNPNKVPRGFVVSGVIEGWRTALYSMKVGDELEMAIPWKLGYGANSSSAIPGYTTLYFRMKLLKIVPIKGRR